MNILDNLKEIKKLDKSNVLGSISYFPKQCLQVLEDLEKAEIPNLKSKVENIVICGMGGSAFAAEICKSLFLDKIKKPLEIIRGYNLPNYVNRKTLVIAASYSGNTEETRSCAKEALKKKALLFVLSSNGKLKELAKQKKLPAYIFKDKLNPCKQPRVGAGYMIFGCLGLLVRSGLVNLEIDSLINQIKSLKHYKNYKQEIKFNNNPAKKTAEKFHKKFIIPVGSQFLEGVIHGFANQLNETAKTNSAYHILPELNHHRMEGLKYPKNFKKLAVFIFYQSDLYHPRVQTRYKITKNVIKKNGLKTITFNLKGKNKIQQVLDTFIFNSYVSFYLGILHQEDPSKIPWVDYFKRELKRISND